MRHYLELKGLIFVVSIFSLWGFTCNKQGKEAILGGPCSYKTTNYPAKIINIEDVGNNQCDLALEINPYNAIKPDTISYYTQNSNIGYASMEEIKKHNLKIGDNIIYEVMEIEKGTCNPHMVSIKIEKFKQK